MEITNNTSPVATTPTATPTAAPAETFSYTYQEGGVVRQFTSTVKLWETDPAVILQRTSEAFDAALLSLVLYNTALETAGVGPSDPRTTEIPLPPPEILPPPPPRDPNVDPEAPGASQAAAAAPTPTVTAAATPPAAEDEETPAEEPPAPTMVTVPTDKMLIVDRLLNRLDGDQNNVVDYYEAERNIQRFARPEEGQQSVLPTGAWGGSQGSPDTLQAALTTYMTRIASFDADGDGELERDELLALLPSIVRSTSA